MSRKPRMKRNYDKQAGYLLEFLKYLVVYLIVGNNLSQMYGYLVFLEILPRPYSD